MRVRALVVAATATLIGLSVALPAPAQAAGTRWMGIQLFAREDVGPLMTVHLLDEGNVDVLPSCSPYVLPPEYFDWSCSLTDEAHTLAVTAPAGVSTELHCRFLDGSETVSTTGSIAIPPLAATNMCWIFTTADTSWPSAAAVTLSLWGPAADLTSAHLALVDTGGTELTSGCVDAAPGLRSCAPPPYGTYSIEFVGLPAGAVSTALDCRVIRTTQTGYGYLDTPSITIDPTVKSLWCGARAARPQVEIYGYHPWEGPPPSFALRPVGGGSDIACTMIGSWRWSCLAAGPGTYELVTDLMPVAPYPKWHGCGSGGGTAPLPGDNFPPAFAFAEGDLDWYVCHFSATAPPPPTTTTTEPGVITGPIMGGGGSVWSLALALLGLGAAMTLLARRPVR